MVTLTSLQPAHRLEWLALWNSYLEFYATDLSATITEATFERLTDPTAQIHGVIAHDEAGIAVGFVHWHTHPGTWSTKPYCYLEDLFVGSAARGTGTGRALIGHVREWAQRGGCAKVYWHSQHTNAQARQLYDKVAKHSGEITYDMAL